MTVIARWRISTPSFCQNIVSAVFVDVIHTNYKVLGAPEETGTAEFWPNDGNIQPGCALIDWDVDFIAGMDIGRIMIKLTLSYRLWFFDSTDVCFHHRSWAYYAESVRSNASKAFNSLSCDSWKNFTQHTCGEQHFEAYMGIDANPMLKGNYFLQTNNQYPFNRGERGTRYEHSHWWPLAKVQRGLLPEFKMKIKPEQLLPKFPSFKKISIKPLKF